MSKARELANLGNAYSDGALSNRNLIINGSFIVNQRNADTAVASGTGWPCDRWNVADNQSGLTQQRNGGSYTKPDGFKNYLRSIVTTATTKGAGDYAVIYQPIEAYNIQQLNWGTSAANKATLSFVSRSNVTGTFGGAIQNHDGSMCYPFTYTVTSADTWEEQVVVIDGATTGAWNHDNGRGITVLWGLGVGSTYSNTAGVWTTSYTFTATGAVDITGTLNNYLAITGVQLEIGDTATPFEHRSYGQELALCQRYYEKLTLNTEAGAIATNGAYLASSVYKFNVTKRTLPSMSHNMTDANYSYNWGLAQAGYTVSNKSGTVGIGLGYTVDSVGMIFTGATFSPTPTALRTGWNSPYGAAEIYADAEL